jgi:peptide/nickel transport system substrate-binding protein
VPPDELVVLIENPPRNIDPRYTTTSIDYKLAFLAYARLVDVDTETLEPRFDLAERIEQLPSPNASGLPLRYEVTLKAARFSDGSEVTAADVAYTIESLFDEKSGSVSLRRRFVECGLVRPVEVVGPRTLRLSYAHSHSSIITDLDFGIVKRGSFEKPDAFGLPIGAGPFVPASEAGEVTRFTQNDYYYAGKPPIPHLTMRVVRDANSRLLSLVGGSADLTQNTVSPLLFEAVKKWQQRLEMATAPSALLFYMGMNTEDARLRDVRVRRALALGIDRERIIRTKLHGAARLATSLVPPFHWAYSAPPPELAHSLAYDPAAAKRLLDEAGFPDPDGDGPKRRFTLLYKTSTDALPVAIARVIAAQLAEIGVGIELRPLEFHIFLSDVKKGNYQLYTLQSAEIAEPNMFRNFFHSAYAPTSKNLDAGLNRMRYRNPEMDALLDEGQAVPERARRKVIYEKVQQMLLRDLPMLPLWHPDNVVVMRRGVVGYRLWPSAQLSGLKSVYKQADAPAVASSSP